MKKIIQLFVVGMSVIFILIRFNNSVELLFL